MDPYPAKLGMTELFPPCEEADIAKFEEEIGYTLPENYRAFLLKWNGCQIPDEAAFPREGKNFEEVCGFVSHLFGLADPRTQYDLRFEARWSLSSKCLPKDVLAIGRNPYTQMIAMSLDGKTCGTVYLWNVMGDLGELPDTPTYEHLEPVADSFEEFFDSLSAVPPDAWPE